ncbi:uncharacterized protein LOC143920854 [Arctopsyche grandis]|uniref:uncharacterized protein LOC143920854 n=1 Tax=Arctopsyche grandis TaxID=121162 RepID=UPI00406D8589
MSVTVKVFCQLAVVFLVAFLDRGIATREQSFEFNEPRIRPIRNSDPYSEFIDDVVSSSTEHREVPIRYYESERRSVRSRRYAEESEFQEPDSSLYDKEQYWNQDEVEVEEDSVVPDKTVEEEDAIPTRRKRQSTPPRSEVRYENHRYDEPDSTYEESRRVPVSKRNTHYEVYESEGDEPVASETRVDTQAGPPEQFVYQGVQYVRAPEHAPPKPYYARRDGSASSEHYHRVPGSEGSPPISRYQRDQAEAATGKAHGHHHSSGGGHQGHDKHSATHGHKDDKGHKSVHHNEHGAKGVDNKEKHAKHYDEHGGKKNSNHDSAGHYGQHHEAAQGHKGGKFDEKKAHKKGHNTKGYHNKYHKDEYHKEHKFYDDYHKSGSHAKYGNFNSKHGSKDGGHKKKEHLDSANHEDHAGKKGHYAKGHVDEDHKAHKNEQGYDKHHAHHSDYAKKGGHQGGNAYAYHTKH